VVSTIAFDVYGAGLSGSNDAGTSNGEQKREMGKWSETHDVYLSRVTAEAGHLAWFGHSRSGHSQCRERKAFPPSLVRKKTPASSHKVVKADRESNSQALEGISWGSMRTLLMLFSFFSFLTATACASVEPYAGAIGGLATISADAGAQATAQGLSLSSYSPSNGGALDVFAGAHLRNYFGVQGNFIWNQNDLVLNSSSSTGAFYRQARSSSQHAGILDFLLYFRPRNSWIRPYLGTGGGVIHLSSREDHVISSSGTVVLPPPTFSSTRAVFRSHVGVDIRISRKLDLRYSFSEFIGKNDISTHLLPPAPRRLANFQNLFGFVVRF